MKFIGFLVLVLCLATFGSKAQARHHSASEKHSFSGMVSHRFIPFGCTSVIVSYDKVDKDTVIYVPKNLPEALDKEGQAVQFNFQPLKIRQARGCRNGLPVRLTEIKAAK
jgi:hypothetical protein